MLSRLSLIRNHLGSKSDNPDPKTTIQEYRKRSSIDAFDLQQAFFEGILEYRNKIFSIIKKNPLFR